MKDEVYIKKKDRYKSSSYRTYNYKVLRKFDKSIWMTLFKVTEWDKSIIVDLQKEIGYLHILDVGCATGRFLESLAHAGANNLYGTDIAPNILDIARAKAKGLNVKFNLQSADAETRIPWDDEFFDVITLSGVFHHFYHPEDALQEIYRMLKKNGRLIIVEPNFMIFLRQILNLYLKIFMHEGDYKFYTPKSIDKLVNIAGFHSDKKVTKVGRFAFKMIFRR